MKVEKFSQAAFDLALERNKRALTRGKRRAKQPQAFLLGGQSGAGKTTIHRIKQKDFQANVIIIDGDSFRAQHPNFLALQQTYGKASVDYTKKFAGQMVESLVDELSLLGYHLVIEGTLRTVEVPQKTASLLTSRGYQVGLSLIATKPELSYLSTLIRYEELLAIAPEKARATPKDYHDMIVHNLVTNLRKLEEIACFDKIEIYQRDQSCVYDSTRDRSPASDILHNILFGEWTAFEMEMLRQGEEKLSSLREKNNRI